MIAAIIQARLGSTRFPNKVLEPIVGKPMLQRVCERALRIPLVEEVAVAVPDTELELAAWVNEHCGLLAIAGHPTDVLERFVTATRFLKADVIIRLTADCPLLCPDAAAEVLTAFQRTPLIKYATNTGFSTESANNVDGLDVQVFSRDILEDAHHYAITTVDREHVTPWIVREALRHKRMATVDGHGVGRKLSVDVPEDLHDVRLIYDAAKALGYPDTFGLGELRKIMATLEGLLRNPRL